MTGWMRVTGTLTTVFTVQVPALQVLRLLHAWPQLPQLLKSVWKFTQPPLQHDGVAAVQAWPQVPQLAASEEVFTQIPLQLVLPVIAQLTVSDPARVRPGLTSVTPGETGVVVTVVVTGAATVVVTAVVVTGAVTTGAGAEQVEALHTRPAAQALPHRPQLVELAASS